MSLRQIAKILGTSHANLSRMISGKRKWNPQLKARYDVLVGTTLVPTGQNSEYMTQAPNSRNDGNTATNWQYGGAEEARTPDPLLAKQVLSQLSYSPTKK